ncbi:oligosaccharide flippase family protein [Membranihabitans maritimus]|uniref:oligosaccharide flippase family protein n=1 Tax=Membranihabitans maritimus TaxID=2904244 RepID=UPI001F46C55F|nr:oligosaccharide flippase family protein [Membranihabitans maritimus]
MATIKRLAGDTVWYGLSSIVGRAINILLLPVITNTISLAQFGNYSLLYSFVAIAFIMYTLRMETAYFRFEQNKEDQSKSFSQSLVIVTITSLLFSTLLFIFSNSLCRIIDLENEYSTYVKMLAMVLFFDAVNEIPFANLRLENRPRKFAVIKLLMIGVNVGTICFFFLICPFFIQQGYLFFHKLYQPELNLFYLFGANVLSSLIAFLLLLPQWKKFQFQLDKDLISRMVKYSLPLTIVGLAGIINETMDRVFLKKLLPYDAVKIDELLGIYSGNYKIAMFIALFTQAFRYAAEPFFFKQDREKDSNILYGKITTYYTAFSAFGFLAIGLGLPWLQDFFLRDPGYKSGYWVTPVILGANLLLGIYYNLSIWYKLRDKTSFGMGISITGAIITILGNLIFIRYYGYMASAWTTLFCYAVMTFLSYIIGRRYYPFRIEFGKITVILIITLGSYLMYEITWHDNSVDSGLLSIVMRIIFFAVPFILFVLWDKKELLNIFKGKL